MGKRGASERAAARARAGPRAEGEGACGREALDWARASGLGRGGGTAGWAGSGWTRERLGRAEGLSWGFGFGFLYYFYLLSLFNSNSNKG